MPADPVSEELWSAIIKSAQNRKRKEKKDG